MVSAIVSDWISVAMTLLLRNTYVDICHGVMKAAQFH